METISATPGSRAWFLGAIADEAALPPAVCPLDAAVVTVRALLDRLTSGQAQVLVSALPEEVRAIFLDTAHERVRRRTVQGNMVELVDHVARDLGLAPVSAELVVGAVFRALHDALPADVIDHVARQLPSDLRAAWLAGAPTTAEEIAGDLELMTRILDDIERTGTLPLRVSAREAFASVLCILAQRLSRGEARELFLGLPRTIRPLVERGMLDRREEPVAFGVDELVAAVAQDLGTDLDEAEKIVDAVLAALGRALPREEIDHVASQLPADLRALWLA